MSSPSSFSNFTASLTSALNDARTDPPRTVTTAVHDFTLCDDIASLEAALSDLRANSTLIVDFEGRDLGEQGGALSIMTLRTTSSESASTYILDAVALSSAQLRPIFDLFASDDIRKVFFDGRKDYCALYHEHHVTLQNVLDMQIADVVSRTVRGEDQDDQKERLYGFLHPPEVRGQKSSYVNVQMLNGLRKCVQEHGLDVGQATNQTVSHTLWMERPLTDQYLKYAASDVFLIHALYDHFIKNNFFDLATLPSQSMRYVSMWRNNQPKSGDMYVAHPLLPLGILRAPSHPTAECISCKRALSRDAFTKFGLRGLKKRHCFVCRAITVRAEMHNIWDSVEEYDEYYGDSDDSGFGGGRDYFNDDSDYSYDGGGYFSD